MPRISEDFEDEEIYFQEDGAPPHYHCDVRSFLDEILPNRWIGQRGFIEYPPCSPDLTPLDFFFLMGKRQSLHYETCKICWIKSSHWMWMHANIKGILSWCVQFHCFALSAVSGPERTPVWEQAVTTNRMMFVNSITFWKWNEFQETSTLQLLIVLYK